METLTKSHSNGFAQGYLCAVASLIRMNNEVDTRTKELFVAGGYKLADLEKLGIDEADVEILILFKKELE
jgi:hypothetical protein